MVDLTTQRLLLRRWRGADLDAFGAINADPRVMRHFVKPLDRAESAAMIARIEAHFDAHGFGFWAVAYPGKAPLIGMVGLARVTFDAPFSPAVEIGWRMSPAYWGQGLATEAARAALDFGCSQAGLAEIVAFTVPANTPSQAVMRRLGMTRDPADDFDHPRIPEGHALRRHVLYRISRPAA